MTLDHTYLMWSAYSSLSWSRQQGCTDALLLRKSGPDSTSQPGWVARGTRLSFSPNTTIEVVHLSQAPIDGRLLDLLCSYHQHVISTFNTCSRGPTHRSWTDTGRCYNLGDARLSHHTLWHSQPTILHFSLKDPTRSQVIHPTIINWTREWTNPKSHEW
jgi:hypothetical protein